MDFNLFRDPTGCKEFTLSPFWFWNDRMDDDRITEQLEIMKLSKIEQPVIHARTGLKTSYLTDEWFGHVAHAVEHAARRGMKIWLYDEKNWPSGNCDATITMETRFREHFLLIDRIVVKPGEPFDIPHNGGDYDAVLTEAVFYSPQHPDGLCVLGQRKPSCIKSWQPPCEGELYAVRVAVSHYEPIGKLCVDYMNKEALTLFTEKTHGQYAAHLKEYFGNTISGIFMDETRFFNALPWTEGFEEEFLQRKGYDIHPYLALLLRDSEQSAAVRYDYFDVVSDLLVEATFKTIYDWCEEHGLQSIGHVLGEETLASQSRFNGDIMRTYKYMHIPGIDHLGNGTGSLEAKICSSAAHSYGRLNVASESFGATGWDMPYEDLVTISNWLFQQGITHILVHGFYYSIRNSRKDDWPPSYFYQWDHWNQMEGYAMMAARMSCVLQGAVNASDILLYYPVETFWAHFKPDFKIQTCYFKDGPEVWDEQARVIDREMQTLATSLLDENLDFEFFHSDAAENFEARDGRLVNRLTGASYSVVVLPCVELIPEHTAVLLNRFQEQGGRVILSGCPEIRTVDKRGAHHGGARLTPLSAAGAIRCEGAQQAAELCRELAHVPFRVLEGCSRLNRTITAYPPRLYDPYIHDGEKQEGVGITVHFKGGDRIYNVTNYNRREETIRILLRNAVNPKVCFPETGEVEEPREAAVTDEGCIVTLSIPSNRACFVICPMNTATDKAI